MSLIIQKWCTGLKMKVNFLIIKGNVKSTGQTENLDSLYTDVREIFFPAGGELGVGLNAICIDPSVPDSAQLCSLRLVVVQCFPVTPLLPLIPVVRTSRPSVCTRIETTCSTRASKT